MADQRRAVSQRSDVDRMDVAGSDVLTLGSAG